MYKIFESDEDNKKIFEAYTLLGNVQEEKIAGGGYCYIFFSSHGLYYPTTFNEFHKRVIEENKFEWMNISKNEKVRKKASKFIFVRDIYKNWCIEGVNTVIDSQDKLANYLRKITKGYSIITVGSSAGGYMALLFGTMLRAEEIIAFSPQISLYEYNKYHKINFFKQYINDSKKSKYEDVAQYKKIDKLKNIYVFSIQGKKHGAALYGIAIINTLISSPNQLKKLAKKYNRKSISADRYLLNISGFRYGLPAVCKEWIKRRIWRE